MGQTFTLLKTQEAHFLTLLSSQTKITNTKRPTGNFLELSLDFRTCVVFDHYYSLGIIQLVFVNNIQKVRKKKL